MGRHAGWIAAAGGLAADADNDIPIVILFPGSAVRSGQVPRQGEGKGRVSWLLHGGGFRGGTLP